jgi:hypothetical protein
VKQIQSEGLKVEKPKKNKHAQEMQKLYMKKTTPEFRKAVSMKAAKLAGEIHKNKAELRRLARELSTESPT